MDGWPGPWKQFLNSHPKDGIARGMKMITLDFDPDRYWSDPVYAEEVRNEFFFGRKRVKEYVNGQVDPVK